MYILAIGWLYVVAMMALTEAGIMAAILTFTFYGAAPLALFLWLVRAPARRRRLSDQMVRQEVGEVDRGNPGGDQ